MSISEPQPKLSFKQAAIVSGLVSERQYEKVVDTAGSDDPNMVAAALVKSGLITEYQAQQLNVGTHQVHPWWLSDYRWYWAGRHGTCLQRCPSRHGT